MNRAVFCPREVYGVIGHPLGHSLSPLLHNWGFQRLGLPKVYMRWPVTPEALPGFVQAVRALPVAGLSVTIPHKERVLPHLDGVSPRARELGAVNTLYWREGRLLGENTDVGGFAAPLRQLGSRVHSGVVLGAGGAARAVVLGLRELGAASIRIAARNPDKAAGLARELGATALDWGEREQAAGDVLVNATPLGMAGKWSQESPYPFPASLAGFGTVYDLVYTPPLTPLLRAARTAGCRTIPGAAMFVHQAAEQFRLWTGQGLPVQEAALVVERALAGQGT
ncbi:MAG: shikimate dehydrogenase [Desulfovibrionales bacterium]